MIKLFTHKLLQPLLNTRHLRFSFSNESQFIQDNDYQELNKAENFYRNSIRKININDKGRGKFTEHHLLRLTKLTEKENQLPLLYEGYYNYLGHFTMVSSRTVDKMLQKIFSFEDAPLEPVLEIFQNHTYLAYFPAYNSTLNLVTRAYKNEQIFLKLIQIFYSSPLIKFNKDIVHQLLTYLKEETASKSVVSSVAKLLMQRSVLKLIDNELTQKELFQTIAAILEARLASNSCQVLHSNQFVKDFLNSIQEKEEQTQEFVAKVAIIALSYGNRPTFSTNLSLIKDQNRVETILNYLSNFSEAYRRSVASYLQSQEHSQYVTNFLENMQKASEQAQE